MSASFDDESRRAKSVRVRRLRAPHQTEPFREFRPLSAELRAEIDAGVREVFDAFGGAAMLKSSGDVYVKPNAVDSKAYACTRVEVLEAVVRYWKAAGARDVFVLENSTICNLTRLVFAANGYAAACARAGAKVVYLDEEPTVEKTFAGRPSVAECPKGYDRTTFRLSRTVAEKLVERRDENLYVSLPKLKTHSMSVVTLGVKNQWAFPRHEDRTFDHNHALHDKLVDVLAHVRPDFTLIEGVEGSVYGHFNPVALADVCVRPFRVLVGGPNVVAADLVGARLFGYEVDDVPHLRAAIERGLGGGVTRAADVELSGDLEALDGVDLIGDLAEFGGKYPWDLYPDFPPDVRFVVGTELACREGCVNNPRAVLQTLYKDFAGRGGFTLVMGKGHSHEAIDAIDGPVLVAGHCAIEELAPRLVERLGASRVHQSGACNDLRATTEALCHLARVSPLKLTTANPIVAAWSLVRARVNGSHGMLVNPLADLVKLR